MPPRKQIYKITYPNGKIWVGMDLIGMLLNVGSPSARERIAADLDAHRLDLMLRKEILWESETATDDEVRAMEVKQSRRNPRHPGGSRRRQKATHRGIGSGHRSLGPDRLRPTAQGGCAPRCSCGCCPATSAGT